MNDFEVIVIGGGHAGTEAALASARIGARTLLLTDNIETLGQMSCNPSIGGIGKGHLVKEIDALGGAMAIAADKAGIHFRTLNASKGPAVRATRVQADRSLYKQAIREILENQPNLCIFQQSVEDVIITNDRITGVITQIGLQFHARTVVLTTGTFLGGKIHMGLNNYGGGRAGDKASNALSQRLRALPLNVGRLKTGTPPRIDGKTIDFSHLTPQPTEDPQPIFSFMGKTSWHPEQVHCSITHTNEKTHEIIRANLHESPMYAGVIEGVGPRYCPSIEDKIVRFAEKNQHQIFLEPEGLHTHEIYPNGISTSLPFAVQYALVRSIAGLENAHITRPGYAIEYDYFDPRDLTASLESKYIRGLFFAGQINGTTGYEEAAAQGLLAGFNAARQALTLPPWTPSRSEAYIGVMIDDLIHQGVTEPYRMFTSRAEYRLLLREDNADLRLTAKGREVGLISDERWQSFQTKQSMIIAEQQRLKTLLVQPNEKISALLSTPITRACHASELLTRPEITYALLMEQEDFGPGVDDSTAAQQIEIQAKYAGYIIQQEQEIAKQARYESVIIPRDFNYQIISGLSNEIKEKFLKIQPETVGAAARIPGVTPAAISLILVYLKK